MTLNFSTFTLSAQIELSDYNTQKVLYSPQFSANDFATLQTHLEETANLLSKITGLRFEQVSLRKKYTKLHNPTLSPNSTIERIGMVVCELVSPPDDYYILEIPDPVSGVVLSDETINLSHTDVLSYANVFRANAYGTNRRLIAESGGDSILLASRRVPSLKAIKSEKAMG